MQKKHHFFVRETTKWYSQNLRDLPWRSTQNPYFIWLSEVILQQTRVEQGTPYYYRFIDRFPTVKDLAEANESDVLKLWEGLGYYSRARNLHTAAKTVQNDFGGKFPTNYNDIRNLKGIGDYTAAAIASLAFNLPHAVVDGNVYRVLSRYFGIETPIDSTKGKKEFYQLANELIDKKDPGQYNQAVMEFGAIQCTPKKPNCMYCPLQTSCAAFNNGTVDSLPVKEKKTKVRDRYFNYLVLTLNEKVYITQRVEKDIWKGLYEFPLIETSKALKDGKLPDLPEWLKKSDLILRSSSKEYKHILSHQRIFTRFFTLELNNKIDSKNLMLVKESELSDFAFPRLILRFLDERS